MIIADKLKNTNRAEYLLYMWQVEDLLRAYGCDTDRIKAEYLSRFHFPENEEREAAQWYTNLCDMMRTEGKMEKGHLQICQNILQELTELHVQLLKSAKFPYYREMYYKVLPYIVELRAKQRLGEGTRACEEPELQTCFDMLYGIIMLRLQKKEISPATEKAVKDVSALLGQLSDYYFQDKKAPIEFE